MGNEKSKLVWLGAILVAVLGLSGWYSLSHKLALLDSKGVVGQREKHLIILSTVLMLIVVVPVYFLTFFIAWRYRASNKTARYEPDQDGNRALELTWWAVPGIIILILSVVTWRSSHSLDPFHQLSSDKPPMTVQVVALPWRWLFIYPQQGVAAMNFVQIPVNTPVDFNITSDAPMNSFWIPQLGGQVYAMAGMNTHLHLMADQVGDYRGVSANISGQGFANMRFTARASSAADFKQWTSRLQHSSQQLSQDTYNQLAQPSQDSLVTFYSAVEPGLYDNVLLKYMVPNPALLGAETNFLQGSGHHHE
jgi:cytochrome o ubiquinol oxidase subunit II